MVGTLLIQILQVGMHLALEMLVLIILAMVAVVMI